MNAPTPRTPRRTTSASIARSATDPILYRIDPADPHAHLLRVTLIVARPAAGGQALTLPAWIPGSYMIREFARHIVSISARVGTHAIGLEKIDKHTWQAAPMWHGGPITVTAEIYARDLSVRGAYLDQTHAFFNGTSVFLRVPPGTGALTLAFAPSLPHRASG